ncbi:hypothetical protein [Sphingobium sp. CCH11-B1]|jgi:hypothetical protein|nr:hypothetical protein [Sphingobium sp. CCH11-B1]
MTFPVRRRDQTEASRALGKRVARHFRRKRVARDGVNFAGVTLP